MTKTPTARRPEPSVEPDSDLRHSEVLRCIDDVLDPCARAFSQEIGLVAMGMIDEVRISDTAVGVRLLPTFPTCLFSGVLAEEVEAKLRALPWCTQANVTIVPDGPLWDESRMSPLAARHRASRTRG